MTAALRRQVEELIARAGALTPAELPPDTVAHAGLVLADSVGVMCAGARSPEVVALADDPSLGLTRAPAGPPSARALVPAALHGTPATVAWLNGTAGTFLELDEGFRPTGHPAMHVVPAALAVAEASGASGAALITAVTAGYEVAARLFESFVLPHAMHPHGHVGALGAATAVAVLSGEDPVALARIAATQPLLTGWDACYAGASARNTWTGHANRAGVQAGVLHRAGFTGSLASHLSVIAPYVREDSTLTEPVAADTLRIRRNYFKFHSSCALNHSALDALRTAWDGLAERDPLAVRRIEVTTVSAALRVDRQAEPNALSTRFSLPYAVATALLTGSTGPASFAWDPRTADFARRVTVTADPALDERWPDESPARVILRTATGSSEASVDNPYGHHSRPATREALREKFVALLTGGAPLARQEGRDGSEESAGLEESARSERSAGAAGPFTGEERALRGGAPAAFVDRREQLGRVFDALADPGTTGDCATLPLPPALPRPGVPD
ncbi:MmgE/PrpD family protein [Streptomyces sp. NPDC051018]|uniref:MmgE/PrpD family protein n=1 Tax=Streptomyces sp. NPDC051018 TaxID=3365639 RepID=UPI00378B8A4B